VESAPRVRGSPQSGAAVGVGAGLASVRAHATSHVHAHAGSQVARLRASETSTTQACALARAEPPRLSSASTCEQECTTTRGDGVAHFAAHPWQVHVWVLIAASQQGAHTPRRCVGVIDDSSKCPICEPRFPWKTATCAHARKLRGGRARGDKRRRRARHRGERATHAQWSQLRVRRSRPCDARDLHGARGGGRGSHGARHLRVAGARHRMRGT
jgi:hypothetical protein